MVFVACCWARLVVHRRSCSIGVAGSTSIGKYVNQDAPPGAIKAVASVTFPYFMPPLEMLVRKVAPGDTCPIDDSFDGSTVDFRSSDSLASIRKDEKVDLLSLLLLVGE